MPMLQLTDVTKTYKSDSLDFAALGGVSFSVEAGEFLSVVGPSGSGKTTLLNLIGCLDMPTRGTLQLDGEELTGRSAHELADIRRHRIGFIFQTFNLIPVLTAYENVEIPLILKGETRRADRRQRIESMLADVGIADLMKRRPSQLSGGQQQRVAIARALVKTPNLILADEPTANLDSRTGQEILELMLRMNQKSGATFIFSTHDRMVMDFGRRLIRLKDGVIESDDSRK